MFFKKAGITISLSVCLALTNFISVNALDKIENIKGNDRYETASLIAEELSKKQKYEKVILVNSDNNLSDGLSASSLAGLENAPILLVKKNQAPKVTLDKLNKVKDIYIIGGLNSIDENIENELIGKGINVKRISGKDRIETSYNVAKEINNIKQVNKVVLTNAFKGEADAMSVASVAARDNSPIVLCDGNTINKNEIPFDIQSLESYVIGGVNAISDKLVRDTNSIRLGGKDRFDTNKKIINKFYPGQKNFYIAKSHNLVDALTGSTIAKDMPIVLVNNGSDKTILKNASKIVALGGIDKSIIEECLNITKSVGNIVTGVVEKKDNSKNNSGIYDDTGISDGTGLGEIGNNWQVVNPGGDWNNQVGK